MKTWKSSDGYDVTASALFIDKKGNKYVGSKKAYDRIPVDPENVAVRFKRMMGTNTRIHIANLDRDLTPEECSAEILKTLFGYLPESMQNDPDLGVVITIPAAFDQKAKEATLAAANMAGLGKVAFMQEPVAAVMSIMKTRPEDGTFVVYDLCGGTLDVAVATSANGRVDLNEHGGIAVCGGRDFDRMIVEQIIYPWMQKNFALPKEFWNKDEYKSIVGILNHAAEQAKIDLSSMESTNISVAEHQLFNKTDEKGVELYVDIDLTRDMYEPLIEPQIQDTIKAVRETLDKAGFKPEDISRIVFVGGPTNYKPLRDKVSASLGIPANTDVNPMTAVSEGAAIYAESIDWATEAHAKKNSRGSVETKGAIDIKFDYIARTPSVKTKMAVHLGKKPKGKYEIQVDSLDSGWSSGKVELDDKTTLELLLSKNGENHFKIFVFNDLGESVNFEPNVITITRTAATIDSIPASKTVSIAVLDKLGGAAVPLYIVKAGDLLPKRGKVMLKAGETLKAGTAGKLYFHLWEGDIVSPIEDNVYIGGMSISGTDFDEGIIPAGADIECIYEMSDDGNIKLNISIPCIHSSFEGKNFYSRQEGQKDYSQSAQIIARDAKNAKERAESMAEVIDDPDLDSAIDKLNKASNLSDDEVDPEKARVAEEQVSQAKRDLDKVRKRHLREVRKTELDKIEKDFEHFRKYASPTDIKTFENLVASAKQVIDQDTHEFEDFVETLKAKEFDILWKQDWFIVAKFKYYCENPGLFADRAKYETLVANGRGALEQDNIDRLRAIIVDMGRMMLPGTDGSSIGDVNITNIVKG